MLNKERQDLIRAQLVKNGRVIATDLAKQFGVSEDAIRRDLRELARLGICRRVYGGALLPAPDIGNIQKRVTDSTENKRKLARVISDRYVKDGHTIFIDSSSTNIIVAAELCRDRSLTVITNSPAVALALSDHALCKIIVLGGYFNSAKGACLGAKAIQDLRNIHIDTLILGVCGIDITLGVTALDFEEAEFKRCLIEQSSRVIAPLTSDKVGTVAPYKFAEVSEIDALILEKGTLASTVSDFSEVGIVVEISD